MEKIKVNRIIVAIIAIAVLLKFRRIREALEPAFQWFGDSLHGLSDFPEGAQTAIAFFSVILLIVIIAKTFGKSW